MRRTLPQLPRQLMMVMCAAAAIAIGAVWPAAADEVVGAGGRLEGEVTFTTKGVGVGDRRINWDDLISLDANRSARVYGQPNLVRMRDGEVWAVEVVSLLNGSLTVRSPLIGERTIPVARVAQVVLNRQVRTSAGMGVGGGGGVLVTAGGEALPGELMWISDQELAIESLLGVMRMPREATASYRFADAGDSTGGGGGTASAAQGGDVVTLVGGGRLVGRLSGRDGGITLQHPVLGELEIAGDRVRSIRRAVSGATLLATLRPVRVEAQPLFSFARLPDLPTADQPSLRLWSGGSVAYALPGPGRLEATVAAVPGARGRSVLRVVCDGKVLATKIVDADGSAQWLSVDVPGTNLVLEATFGDVISIPSGVALMEPRLVTK